MNNENLRNNNVVQNNVVFTKHMLDNIENGDSIAATDSSVKGKYYGGYWTIGDVH